MTPNEDWPRYWALDIYTNEPGATPAITTGKLLIQLASKEDLKLQYLCMCGNTITRFTAERVPEINVWVKEHRPHNHRGVLNLILERLRPDFAKLFPEL